MLLADEIAIEMARVVRECEERVAARIASQQLGELFADIDEEHDA